MWVKISICDDHSHQVYFAQVPPLVDWGQICGGRLQFLGETLNFTSLVWCHHDMFFFSGCLLQLLCPCYHVLVLRSLNSWGTCQVVSYHQLILSRTILVHGRGENPNSLCNIYSQDIPKGRPGTFQQDVLQCFIFFAFPPYEIFVFQQ